MYQSPTIQQTYIYPKTRKVQKTVGAHNSILQNNMLQNGSLYTGKLQIGILQYGSLHYGTALQIGTWYITVRYRTVQLHNGKRYKTVQRYKLVRYRKR
jgi:hypothetical protein